MSGPVTSVARVEDVQIFLKDPVLLYYYFAGQIHVLKQSHYRPEWSRGFQEVKVPSFHDNGTGWW